MLNLPVHKRRQKKEVEIRRNIICQNPLVLSLSLRRRKKKHYCLTTSPEANKNDLKIVLVRSPLNKNSCYALQYIVIWNAFTSYLHNIQCNDDDECKIIRKEKWRFLTIQRKKALVSLCRSKEALRCLESTCQININVFNVSNQ